VILFNYGQIKWGKLALIIEKNKSNKGIFALYDL